MHVHYSIFSENTVNNALIFYNLELFEFLKHRNFSSEIEGDVLNKQEHKKNVELLIARRKVAFQTVQKTETDVQMVRNGIRFAFRALRISPSILK